MYKILITGGRGFIGTNLTHEFRSRGHDVWTCDILQGDDEKHFKADVAPYRQRDSILAGHSFDYVYHLTAEFGRWNGEDFYETLRRSNVIGTKNLIRLQEKQRFRIIFFSSSEVYGDYGGVIKEEVMDTREIQQLNGHTVTRWAGARHPG